MFQIDEKAIADNRTLITIQGEKTNINPITKNGTIHYTNNGNNLWLTTPKIRQAYINKDPNLKEYYDRIIIARNGTNIDGSFVFDDNQVFGKSVEIKENLVVRGDFTVEGNSSVIDTPSLTVEDNVIELNRNERAAGITLKKSGLALNRGTRPFARYLYNETNKAFILDTSTSMDADVADAWVLAAHTENNGSNIAGEVRVKAKLTVPTGNITDNLTVAKNTTTDTLTVNSTSSHGGASTFNSTVTIADTLTANGRTLLNNTLNVKGTANFESDVTLKQNLTVDRIGTFKERAVFQKGLNITSLGADIAGPVNITGNTVLTGTLTVTEDAQFNKDVNVTETINTKNINVSTTATTKDLSVTNNATIAKNTVINGTTTLNGVTAINANTTITATKTTVNSLLEVTGDTTITNKNLTTTSTSDSTGNLDLGGSAKIRKNLVVDGSTTMTGNVDNSGDLIARNVTSRNNVSVHSGDGKGYRFSDDDKYKIYMATKANSSLGGDVTGATASDQNMYFVMTDASAGNNRGYVFKNGATSLFQIEGSGKAHVKDNLFAKGSQVLRHADMGHSPANNTAINACMVDGKQATDLVLRDGSQAMTGDLQMASFRIKFSNDDFISYNDGDATIGSQTYNGKYSFTADNDITRSNIEAGSFKAGNVGISGKDNVIVGVAEIQGAFGTVIKSNDEWLRINDDASHTNGTFFGNTIVRTDGTIQIGTSGTTLLANATSFKYKNADVITTVGHNAITGDLVSSGVFKTSSSIITQTAGSLGRLVSAGNVVFLQAGIDTNNNAGNMRLTGYNNQNLNSFDVKVESLGSATINGVKILTTSDAGAGNNLDADKLDGKHYSDLVSQFVDTAGDTMTGKLTMNNSINMTANNLITFNSNDGSYVRSGGSGGSSLVLSAADQMFFCPANTGGSGDPAKQMILLTDGNLQVRGSNVLRVADEGHGKGLDADTLDGQHKEYFATATHLHDDRYTKKEEVDLKNKYKIQYNAEQNSLDFMYMG